jgi:predicted NBD/HSP70 family sugar kinase
MSTTNLSRQVSLRSVVEIIMHQGPISRAVIAAETGMSKQTISDVVRVLDDAGWVVPIGRARGKAGRSAVLYRMQNDAAYALGVDLGGTKLHVGIGDLSCEVVGQTTEPTDPRGGRHVIDQIRRVSDDLLRRSKVPKHKLRIATVGSPGVVEPATGRITMAPKIPGLEEFDVVAALSDALETRVLVDNDVNLATIGESWQGHGRGVEDFVFLALGTGVGMGVMAGGKLIRGARNASGEVAYLPIGVDPFMPHNGIPAHFEQAVSTSAILERYAALGGRTDYVVRDIFDALPNDAAAHHALEETARVLALGIAAVWAVLDPQFVVLGGSVGVRPELTERVMGVLPRCTSLPIRLKRTDLGQRGPLLGALGIGLKEIHNELFNLVSPRGELDLPTRAPASGT